MSISTEDFFYSATIQDLTLAIGMNQAPGYSTVDKFGENPEIDTGTAPEDIWEFGGEYNYDAFGTDPIRYISSSSVLDVGQVIGVQGLDINGNLFEGEVVTNGQNVVNLPTPLWRVFRLENNSDEGGDIIGTLFCHTDSVPTAGVPLAANVRAIISNGNNQTLMALYTIPKGYIGYLFRGELGTSRAQTTGAARCAYYSRRLGKVFKIKKRVDLTNQGSSVYQDHRSFPDIIPALTDIRLKVESVSANGMGIFGAFDIMLVEEKKFTDAFLSAIGQPR